MRGQGTVQREDGPLRCWQATPEEQTDQRLQVPILQAVAHRGDARTQGEMMEREPTFSELQDMVHKTATDAGWYNDPATGAPVERNVGEVIALMHSELSEALEAARKDLMDDKLPHRKGIEVEFADCIIRIMDTAAAHRLDLVGAILEKNEFNRNRADHKLENRAKAGGKKF